MRVGAHSVAWRSQFYKDFAEAGRGEKCDIVEAFELCLSDAADTTDTHLRMVKQYRCAAGNSANRAGALIARAWHRT